MNYSMIRYILCSVLGFEGLFLLLPALVGAIYGEKKLTGLSCGCRSQPASRNAWQDQKTKEQCLLFQRGIFGGIA